MPLHSMKYPIPNGWFKVPPFLVAFFDGQILTLDGSTASIPHVDAKVLQFVSCYVFQIPAVLGKF